jgi:mRNA interferase MazF
MVLSQSKPDYRRFEIWWVKLDPTEGSEAGKTRPCLILQNDLGNQYSDVTVVVPFLEPKDYPFVVNILPTPQNGLDRERGLNFSQIRVVYYARFVSKLGELEPSYHQQIEEAIAIEFAIFGR